MPPTQEIKHFIIHLRIHYQILALSGAYLLGGVFSTQTDPTNFVIQFFNVHVLLYGGISVYNSYHDKDTGPIGGIKHPPPLTPWMIPASWILQLIGLVMGFAAGIHFVVVYAISILMFWLYSNPKVRLKASPILSLLTIVFTFSCLLPLLGFLAFGNGPITFEFLLASLGFSCTIVSMYPISQIYQIDEDKKRGDITYAVKYGVSGIIRIFSVLYFTGILLISLGLYARYGEIIWIFIIGSFIVGLLCLFVVKQLSGTKKDYDIVMKIKYISGIASSLYFLYLIFAY